MESTNTTPEASAQQTSVAISTEGMQNSYSNFVRGLMTPEEIILDFGINPNSAGKIVEEPAVVHNRVIMSIPSAVRLHQLLHSMLSRRQQAQDEAAARQAAATSPS
jgi:hypothetical protein